MMLKANNTTNGVAKLCCALVCATILIMGCGPAQVQTRELIPKNINVIKQQAGTVQLDVAGGRSEHAMKLPEISNEMFLEALKTAVTQSELFQSTVTAENGDYFIKAHIFNLSKPFWGRAPVSLEIAWQLLRTEDRELIWKEGIVTSDEGFGDSGEEVYDRVAAIEGAARKNIGLAIERMSALDIDPVSK